MENRNKIVEEILKARSTAEKVEEELQKAREKDEELAKKPVLTLEEVTEQMGKGMVHYPDGNIRFAAVSFFGKRVAMPIPVDYLNRHTTEKEVVVLMNEVLGISLQMQLTKSQKKNVTFEEVKRGMIGQLRAAGMYVELIDEGTVEDSVAPLYFVTYRLPIPQGVMFHLVFYAINRIDGSMIIGDYNCFYTDVEKWENIMKATISYFTFR